MDFGGHSQTGRWIPKADYDLIQARVPILCVDLLPISTARNAVGLIRRETADGGEGWCLIGGAVGRDEPLLEAVARHVRSTLGDRFEFRLVSADPLAVVEYFTDPSLGELHDPRKHAVALSYVAVCKGEPTPAGEALEFRWFPRDELIDVPFGFGQGATVDRLLDRLGPSY
jgi:ADP-ribose pyrophosphatase YjhB (NUDIX family)